ncbi:uncharacterized protein LOC100890391 [Strongylocentrotus purpuratus]|uniref:Death domain-containing protein n=1 Tax=Strongylocentrotus purpuratus TaxID=7668 RepID=A0A7M7LT12_STRPU|nr:uncharacterized protein LOC100890391 [Strongylocentrotus purpuratus]|eukprot:XP_011668800.1 PREDICTED: uncharacterized protein LOC100890391 [Strongylocentrotus purpuratus]
MAEHRATKRRMKQHPHGHGSRPRFEKTMEGVSDELIFEMAETIGDNQKLPKLASKLGFKDAGAEKFVKMNRMNGIVSSEGTRKMFCEWREDTPVTEQLTTLEAALVDADLAGIADKFSSMVEGKARNEPSFPMEISSWPVSDEFPEGGKFGS